MTDDVIHLIQYYMKDINKFTYYMTSSVSGQDEPNLAL